MHFSYAFTIMQFLYLKAGLMNVFKRKKKNVSLAKIVKPFYLSEHFGLTDFFKDMKVVLYEA